MNRRTPAPCAVFILVNTLFSVRLFAQYVCEFGNGPVSSAQPSGITPAEIVERFATRESIFKAAREHYGYTVDVTIETLDGNQVSGTYKQVSEVALDDRGERVQRSTFAPESSLRQITVTKEDLDDVRNRLSLVFTAEELSRFSAVYVGQQHVDQLDTYVFDVRPKDAKKEKQAEKDRFQGRIWVDAQDFVIVKTCGKNRSDEYPKSRNAPANLTPTFVTYREQIDGKFWFATYSRADEILHFPRGGVRVRETVKYSNYKALPAK